ncbi:MAG: OsmC family protein [Candidatus Omnitrophota bacterium]
MYKVEIKTGPEGTFIAKSINYEFVIGTQDKGMSPPEILLASLGSCIAVYIRKYAKGSNVTLENFTINVEAEFVKEPPICFKEIKISIDLGNIKLDERRKKALLEFIKNCPVHNTLKAKPDIAIQIL